MSLLYKSIALCTGKAETILFAGQFKDSPSAPSGYSWCCVRGSEGSETGEASGTFMYGRARRLPAGLRKEE